MKKRFLPIGFCFSILLKLGLWGGDCVQAQVITTIAGNGTAGYGGDGGAATAAELSGPTGITVDGSGNIFIADYGNNRIRKVSPSGTVSTIAGNGTAGYGGDGGAATAAKLKNPAGIAIDGSGNIYIADEGNLRIRKVTPSGSINTFAGNGTGGYSGDGGAATAAKLNGPMGVTTDGAGNVYFADRLNHRIRRVTPSGTISTIAGSGYGAGTFTGGYNGDGGAATAAELNNPADVAIDGSGNLYIADWYNARVRKVTPSGTISTIAGNGTAGYSGDGGAATAAKLYTPYGVAVDRSGNVYIADNYNYCIRMVMASGIINTIAGNGTYGYSGDGGVATLAELNNPTGVAIDSCGNLFIADNFNERIRKVTPSGTISTFAGTGLASYGGDGGPATAAKICDPRGVAIDASGNVYIGDIGNARVRKVTPSGIINTFAGIGTSGFSGDGGAATAAEFKMPVCVFFDGSGNVYISDVLTHRIRKVDTCRLPAVAAVTGSASLCPGSSITLNDTTTGGTWSSSNSSIATVNSATGMVTALVGGMAIISYSVTNGCGPTHATAHITVTPTPHATAISGVDSLCPGYTSKFTNATPGGNWVSTNTSIATVNSSGLVTSVMDGAVNILYIVTNLCGSDTAVFHFLVKSMTPCPDAVTSIDHKAESIVMVYPSPNEGNFTIAGNVNGTGELTFEVRDVIGRVVKTGTGAVINGKFEVAVQLDRPLNDGYYYVRIFAGGVVCARSFVVGR